tara:strand:- start:115 stop:318 length:204 start_codon:yes stop_codon:yes gene_type:complete
LIAIGCTSLLIVVLTNHLFRGEGAGERTIFDGIKFGFDVKEALEIELWRDEDDRLDLDMIYIFCQCF